MEPLQIVSVSDSTVVSGDAYDLISRVAPRSIDLILTSPPYWGLRSYGLEANPDVLRAWTAAGCEPSRTPPYDWYKTAGGILGNEPYPSWYIDHLIEFFTRTKDKLKESASLWINLGDTYFARWSSVRDGGRQGLNAARQRRKTPTGGYLHDKQLLLLPARFAIAMQEAGWILRNDLIWAKPKVLPRPEKDRLRLAHEHWFHFVQRSRGTRPKYFYDMGPVQDDPLDVVMHSAEKGTNGHTATFPTQLVRARILSSCPDAGLVVDPFAGTGRAIVEAINLGRRALGFELSAPFARTAKSDVDEVLGRYSMREDRSEVS